MILKTSMFPNPESNITCHEDRILNAVREFHSYLLRCPLLFPCSTDALGTLSLVREIFVSVADPDLPAEFLSRGSSDIFMVYT